MGLDPGERVATSDRIEIAGPVAPFPAWLAVPEGEGPWPGVVVIHDVLGMTNDLRTQAEWLAGEGFLTVAPNLFARGSRPYCVLTVGREVLARQGRAFDEVEAVRTWLAVRPDCTGSVGVVGFCFGGGFAVVLAAGRGFSAASVNYGLVPSDADTLLAHACPVVGSYGALDRAFLPSAARLEGALARNHVPHDVKVYPGAHHAFLNDHAPADMPWIARILPDAARPMRHHPPSATDARRRIASFFHTHLGAVSPR